MGGAGWNRKALPKISIDRPSQKRPSAKNVKKRFLTKDMMSTRSQIAPVTSTDPNSVIRENGKSTFLEMLFWSVAVVLKSKLLNTFCSTK